MSVTAHASQGAARQAEKIRVMIVDDSAVIRGFLTRWIEADPGLAIVATACNGKVAVDSVKVARPDVIVLDIEMPEMDGLTALPLLINAAPQAKIVMASTLTRRNAEISMKALSLGAADYLAKPTSVGTGEVGETFRRDLIGRIYALGGRIRKTGPGQAGLISDPIKLRQAASVRPQIIAIGSSTGGPPALLQIIAALAPGLDVPVVITQHMPATFTAILAENLARASHLNCQEGKSGTMLAPGCVYIAPGNYHMEVSGRGGPLMLSQAPPENFCRPAVDPMFRSIAAAYGSSVLALVLTGMGADGREGGRAIASGGGTVLAQDEATSVVWGMPGAVAQAGLASAVLPLNAIAGEVRKYLGLKTK
ncbi:MAG: chemotaxis response regulator protein-glutamate methylesterase [Alphaproteobacteria bacterium]|nr:chemotaxis response regulator protein-glutamate methylesterase [Alphaproteobacteria bacterium]